MQGMNMRRLSIVLIIAIVGIVGCENREEARRKAAVNNLKQIGMALHAYHTTNSEPADGGESTSSDQALPATDAEKNASGIGNQRQSVPE